MDENLSALAEWLAKHQTVQKVALIYPDGDDPGMDVKEIEAFAAVDVGGAIKITTPHNAGSFESFRTGPRSRTGTAAVEDLETFVKHVNRFKVANSALWCHLNDKNPSLWAFLDYHDSLEAPPSEVDKAIHERPRPRFGRHRTVYPFPLSPEWLAWQAQNGVAMGQGDFAGFLEDRILDVVERTAEQLSPRVSQMAHVLGGHFASPARLMELSRGLTVHQNEKVKNVVNISNGEVQIAYEATNIDEQGAPLKIPNMFLIAVPVWRSGPLYILPARLRYRIIGGVMKWHFNLSYVQETFEAAIKDAAGTAATDTGLPLFYGQPEYKD